jgi:RNA polymerase sigma-70 factor (ECF subfamily)
MDDKELIQKVAEKDHLAFKMLIDRYQTLVLNTCFNFLGNRQNAEDVAQEVFLQVYKSARKFRHQCLVSTWVYRITVNRCLNFIRDNRRFRWLDSLSRALENENQRGQQALWSSSAYDPEFALRENETRALIQKAVTSLPGKQKTMFILNKYEGLSYQEIAKILDVSLSSVEAGLHRAKSNLQKSLALHFKKIEEGRKLRRQSRVK